MFCAPRPAPYRCSPAAHAVASLSSTAGRSKAAVARSTIGRSSQPGRCSGAIRIPFAESSGPPQPMPTPTISGHGMPDSSTARRPSSRRRRDPSSAPRSTSVGATTKPWTAPSAPTTPAAIFVPPMSSPSTAPGATSRPASAATTSGARSEATWCALALAALYGDAADEVLLEHREQQDHRHDEQQRPRHDHLVVALAAALRVEPVEQELHAERRGEERLVAEVDERVQEVEPLRLHLEDEGDDQRRLRERQRNPAEHREIAVAVHPRGLEVVARNAEEELSQEEDVERAPEQVRHPERVLRARPDVWQPGVIDREVPDLVPQEVDRDHRHLLRQHHRREEDREQQVAQREAEVGERERDDRARERHDPGPEEADPEAVPQPVPDGRDVEEQLRERARLVRAGEVPRPVVR